MAVPDMGWTSWRILRVGVEGVIRIRVRQRGSRSENCCAQGERTVWASEARSVTWRMGRGIGLLFQPHSKQDPSRLSLHLGLLEKSSILIEFGQIGTYASNTHEVWEVVKGTSCCIARQLCHQRCAIIGYTLYREEILATVSSLEGCADDGAMKFPRHPTPTS